MTHLFILNPFAGTKDSTPLLKAEIEALGRDDTVIEYTKCKGDAESIARRYAGKDLDKKLEKIFERKAK